MCCQLMLSSWVTQMMATVMDSLTETSLDLKGYSGTSHLRYITPTLQLCIAEYCYYYVTDTVNLSNCNLHTQLNSLTS